MPAWNILPRWLKVLAERSSTRDRYNKIEMAM